jgi:ABC-type transporter Mla MlaB component
MKIDRIEDPEGITFAIHGSLTGLADSGIKLFEQINSELESSAKPIRIDLEKSLFVDSIAVGLIIGVMLKAKGNLRDITLRHVPDHIRQVLDNMHLKKAFPDAY